MVTLDPTDGTAVCRATSSDAPPSPRSTEPARSGTARRSRPTRSRWRRRHARRCRRAGSRTSRAQPAGSRRLGPTARHSTAGGSSHVCSSTPVSATPGSSCSVGGTTAPCWWLRSGCSRWPTPKPTSRSRGAPSTRASPRFSAPRRQFPWRRSRPSWVGRGTGTSCTGAATTTSSRASCTVPRRAGAKHSSSRSTPVTWGGAPATSTSGTCRSRAGPASRSTPRTRCSAGSWRSASPPGRRRSPSPSRGPRPGPCARLCR